MGILFPFFGMMLLTMVVWLFMYYRRLSFMRRQNIEPQAMATVGKVKSLIPPDIELPAENLANLFELPVLFYVVCLFLLIVNRVSDLDVVLAWVFFAARLGHSIVHCTYNQVMQRFLLYVLSSFALWAMIVKVAWDVLSHG